jgi:hypothetical protein
MRHTCWIWMVVLAGCASEYRPKGTQEPDRGVGNPADLELPTQVDRFVQQNMPKVDVLWLVDNSSSMGEEQQGIADNLPVFLDFFLESGLDYHIGVISTDMEDPDHQGRLQKAGWNSYITPETVDPVTVLAAMTTLGVLGSGDEKGRDPIFAALDHHRDAYNHGFYREDASLHVVAISDEEDSSQGISEDEFLQWMKDLKGDPERVTFSSIVSPAPVCPGANDPGVEYIRYTEALGGIFWPICDRDWATVLEALGTQATALSVEFPLSAIPVPETLEVVVIEQDITFTFVPELDYTYDATRVSVRFVKYVPQPGAQVQITYALLSAAGD